MTVFAIAKGLLAVTGIFAWAFIALVVFLRTIGHPHVRRVLESRRLMPYTLFTWYRSIGALTAALKALRLTNAAPEVIAAHRSITLTDMSQLRDVLSDMDQLPTIRTGKSALGLDSMFDMSTRNVPHIPSPYTHPMQHPPYLVPGVPARTFYDPCEFEWAPRLEE